MADHGAAPPAGTTARVGVVGAGQLARMLALAAAPLGIVLRVLGEDASSGAAQVVADVVVGRPDRAADLLALAHGMDVVTLDHELVPTSLLRGLERRGTPVRPGPSASAFGQDKLLARAGLSALGLPLPRWELVTGLEDLDRLAADVGYPLVLKRATGGYDGRGVEVVTDRERAELLLAVRGEADPVVWVGEELVDIAAELAVVLARRPGGELVSWPVVRTEQVEGVCRVTTVPSGLSPADEHAALELGTKVAHTVDAVGVLAVEIFLTTDGRLLVNELALRTHNSGHWTIEGSHTSQFANHLRAVLDWPLGSTALSAPAAVTVNVLGAAREPSASVATRTAEALGFPDVAVHSYGKGWRPGRKLGHVTAVGTDPAQCRRSALAAAAVVAGEPVPVQEDLPDVVTGAAT